MDQIFAKEKPFTGAGDAALVVCESAEPFHVVLAGITIANCTLPDLEFSSCPLA